MVERQWYYVRDGQQCGPVSEAVLIDLFHQRALGPATRVWTQGMEDWHEASTINALAPAALLPSQGGPPLAAQSFHPARPTSVTVFGILNIIFGSLCLLYMSSGLIKSFVWPDFVNSEGSDTAWTWLSVAIEFISSILLIVVGIGLLYLKAWARKGSLVYGWFAIVWGIIDMVVSMRIIMSCLGGDSEMVVAGWIGVVCGGLISLIYPFLLIIFMQRPNVKEACTR